MKEQTIVDTLQKKTGEMQETIIWHLIAQCMAQKRVQGRLLKLLKVKWEVSFLITNKNYNISYEKPTNTWCLRRY